MTAQERAASAAEALATAVAEMAGPADGEMAIIIRSTTAGSAVEGTQASSNLLWSWDWFWRPVTDRPES